MQVLSLKIRRYIVGVTVASNNFCWHIDQIGELSVVSNSSPPGIKHFVSGMSISFKCECRITMQIQYTKNLNPGRFELGTTLR